MLNIMVGKLIQKLNVSDIEKSQCKQSMPILSKNIYIITNEII